MMAGRYQNVALGDDISMINVRNVNHDTQYTAFDEDTRHERSRSHKRDESADSDSESIIHGVNKQKDPKGEKPKVALSRNRIKALFHISLFHAMPLGAAITLLALNFRGRYVSGIDGGLIGWFQFPAKVHEILMQISISTAVLGYTQHLLTGEGFVPFGSLFAPYQVTNTGYLISKEFWAAATTSSFSGIKKALFVLFIPISLLLASAVGPASAIAMLPRETNTTLSPTLQAYNATMAQLYPDTFDQPGPGLNATNPNKNELSPAAGWENFQRVPQAEGAQMEIETGIQQEQVKTGENTGKQVPKMPSVYPLTMWTYRPWSQSIYQLDRVERQMYLQYAPNSTFATIQHVPIPISLYDSYSRFLPELQDEPGTIVMSTTMPQAYASVLCYMNSIYGENDTDPIQFPNKYIVGCGDPAGSQCRNPYSINQDWEPTNHTSITREQIWKDNQANATGQIYWVDDIPVATPQGGKALGAIIVQPDNCTATKPNEKSFLSVSACTIGAVWANVTTSFELTSNGLSIDFKTPASSNIDIDTFSQMPEWSQPSVRLTRAWAESLNPVTALKNRTVIDNLLRWLPMNQDVCPTNGTMSQVGTETTRPSRRPWTHEVLLSAMVANGMSHAGGVLELWRYNFIEKNKWYYTNFASYDSNRVQDEAPGVILTIHARIPGYAYNLSGTPIKLATAILMLYCVYTVAYTMYTVVTGRSATTWKSIAELVALAIRSRPSEQLNNTGAGIDSAETYRKLVSVREVPERKLEMVFVSDADKAGLTRRITEGHAYH